MGVTRRCPHCGKGIDLGSGFCGFAYTDSNGYDFDPAEREICPECGKHVGKDEWGAFVMLWD